MTARSMDRLGRFLGDWRVEIEGRLEGQSIRGSGTILGRGAMGGGVLLMVIIEMEGQEPYGETSLLGYSEEEREVHRFTVSSKGPNHDHMGSWRSDDVLYLEWSGIRDGRPITEKIRYEWEDDDGFEIRRPHTTSGKVHASLTHKVVRAPPMLEETMAMPA